MDSFEHTMFFKSHRSRVSCTQNTTPTFQWSLSHLSGLYLLVVVPPFHFLDNFRMTLNVLRRWFTLLHLLQKDSQDQVVPVADGSEKVAKTTKQATSWVPLLMSSLVRECTFQDMIGINFCYWCIEVLCQIVLVLGRECHTKGWKRDGKGPKKKFSFFHCTWPSTVNSLYTWTCCVRVVVHGITDHPNLWESVLRGGDSDFRWWSEAKELFRVVVKSWIIYFPTPI